MGNESILHDAGCTLVASVIIPAYNAEATLGEQLDALCAQDAPFGFEILVCDNGSTDGTASLVRSRRERMPALRLVDASGRRGPAAARNIGVSEARTTILLFCDADDVVDTSWVRVMATHVGEHAFVAGLMEHALLNPRSPWTGGWVEPTYREGFLPWLAAAGSGNMGVQAEVFASVGGFDETRPSGEDADLSWRLQLAGHEVHSAWDAVVHVRKREGLRATIRQGFAKGTAVRQLKHDYAVVAHTLQQAARVRPAGRADSLAAGVTAPSESLAAAHGQPGRLGRLRRIPGRAARVLRQPSQLLRECGEVSSWLGFRFGRIDESRALVDPGLSAR